MIRIEKPTWWLESSNVQGELPVLLSQRVDVINITVDTIKDCLFVWLLLASVLIIYFLQIYEYEAHQELWRQKMNSTNRNFEFLWEEIQAEEKLEKEKNKMSYRVEEEEEDEEEEEKEKEEEEESDDLLEEFVVIVRWYFFLYLCLVAIFTFFLSLFLFVCLSLLS